MHKVMFVCLGNICRSPAAEGILREMIKEQGLEQNFSVDSCGLGDWHVGHLADERMRMAAQTRGVLLTGKAKKFQPEFLDQFDYLLAADQEVLQGLYQYAKTPEQLSKIHLMTAFSTSYAGQNVPDPYYYGYGSFELVLDILEDSCQAFIQHLTKK